MNTSTKDQIIVVGSINSDMVVGVNKLPKPGETLIGHKFFMNSGGKGGNQAVAAARMGGEVSMVANLGADVFGDSAIAKLKDEGVNCEDITRDKDSPSGVAIINVDSSFIWNNLTGFAHGQSLTFRAYNLDVAGNRSILPSSPSSALTIDLEAPSLVSITSNDNDDNCTYTSFL